VFPLLTPLLSLSKKKEKQLQEEKYRQLEQEAFRLTDQNEMRVLLLEESDVNSHQTEELKQELKDSLHHISSIQKEKDHVLKRLQEVPFHLHSQRVAEKTPTSRRFTALKKLSKVESTRQAKCWINTITTLTLLRNRPGFSPTAFLTPRPSFHRKCTGLNSLRLKNVWIISRQCTPINCCLPPRNGIFPFLFFFFTWLSIWQLILQNKQNQRNGG
jgi:hypothetical protein